MIFLDVNDVDKILGVDWADVSKKSDAVFKANVWLSAKKFCSGLNPISSDIKTAGAYLAKLASNGELYKDRADGVVKVKKVKADSVEVQKEYIEGSESPVSGDMQMISDLISPYECKGFGFNTRVCK